jgi:hypothetical protein
LKAADQICRAEQAQLSQRRGRQTRAVALVANDDNAVLITRYLSDAVRARRIQPPLQHVPVDDRRTGQFPVTLPLLPRADIDNQAAGGLLGCELGSTHPVQAGPGSRQQLSD